jgi:hypothetical protein
MGNSELGTCNLEMHSAKHFTAAVPGSNGAVSSLSYSLDKGLDEYEEIKKAQNVLWLTEANITKQHRAAWNLAHVGSEPILNQNLYNKMTIRRDHDTASSSDEAQKWYLQNWQAHGPAPVCSDDDTDALHNTTAMSDHVMDVMQMRSQTEDGSSFSWDHNALAEESSSLPAVHDTANRKGSSHVNVKNIHQKGNIENGSTVTTEDSWCVQELVTSHPLQTESPAGGQDVNALHTSMLHVVIPDSSSTNANLKNSIEVGPMEDSVFSGASVVRESYEAMGMTHLSCESDTNLERLVGFRNMLESPIVDSVLTSRTEALARRTASFNLVRTRYNSSFEDAS